MLYVNTVSGPVFWILSGKSDIVSQVVYSTSLPEDIAGKSDIISQVVMVRLGAPGVVKVDEYLILLIVISS